MVLATKSGTRVPSVTRVIDVLSKPALYRWHNKQGLKGVDTTVALKFETKTGTLLHAMVESYVKTGGEYLIEDPVYEPEHIQRATHAYEIFKEWAKDHKFEDVETEITLVSEKYEYGGTLDIYCKLDGIWTLIDIKTSGIVYQSQLLQVAAYEQLLKEANKPVERVLIVSVDKYEEIPAAVEILTDNEKYFNLFKALREALKWKDELNWR